MAGKHGAAVRTWHKGVEGAKRQQAFRPYRISVTSSVMMERPSAHVRSFFKTSEFLGIVLLVFAVTLQYFYPLHVFTNAPWLRWVGCILLFCGFFILQWTHFELKKHEQPRAPGLPTTKLLQSGPFRWSRNPIYAAIVVLLAPGIGSLIQNPWVFLLLPSISFAFYVVMIREEEAYLKEQFRGEWEAYCTRTRRWI